MTAIGTPPRPPAPPPPPPSPPSPPARTDRGTTVGAITRSATSAGPLPGSSEDLLATGALTLLTLASTVGLWRLFAGRTFVAPAVLAALVAHIMAWTLRRQQLPAVVTWVLSLGTIALLVTWLLLPETTFYGLPSADTISHARLLLNQAATDFKTVVPPAPVTTGFEIATVLGVASIAFLADWAAFRIRTVFEACIPAITLFVFTAVLANRRPQGRAIALFFELAGLMVFVLVQNATTAGQAMAWFASRRRGAIHMITTSGAAIGAVAVFLALVLGPQVPWANDRAVFSLRNGDGNGPSSRSTVSPLVDIRTRLVEQNNVEVFTVKTTTPSYWRLSSLDTFDGNIWSSNDSYSPARSTLPRGVGPPTARSSVSDFKISTLSSIWLPAPYEPVRIDGISGISYNASSGSLISKSDTSDGLTYTVESVIPAYGLTAAQLQHAPTQQRLSDADIAHFLNLPGTTPTDVKDLATSVTNAGATEYDKARLLQDYFQKKFVYDLNVPAGHQDRALERFLFTTRRGYCEQFAGSYAVMARAIGLPTRVAVGFTPGDRTSDGLYHVKDLNAHAWPEVYFPQFGWIAFEPTPTRAVPGGAAYTGITDTNGNGNTSAVTTPTTAAGQNPKSTGGRTTPDKGLGLDGTGGAGVKKHHTSVLALMLVTLLWVGGALLAVALYVAAVFGLKRVRRQRRRLRGTDPAGRVLVAWAEAGEALGYAGMRRRSAETFGQFIARTAARLHLDPPVQVALNDLGAEVTAACYAGDHLPPDAEERSFVAAGVVERWVDNQAKPWQRFVRLCDPRPLLWRGRRQATTAGGDGGTGRSRIA